MEEPFKPGEPIDGKPGEWTYVSIPESLCMDGSGTGIAVNFGTQRDRVLLFLDGGGACFDEVSCLQLTFQQHWDANNLAIQQVGGQFGRGIFDRNDPKNPVRDWSFVFIPYCSGDVHAGTNPNGTGGRTQTGYLNVGHDLKRIVPTFPNAERVLLVGMSAGGFGAVVNYPRIHDAFAPVPVDMVDDSGPIMDDEFLKPCLQTLIRKQWGVAGALPADCPECTRTDGGGLSALMEYAAKRAPERRFALLSHVEDGTIRSFYGYGYSEGCNIPGSMPPEDYTGGLNALRKGAFMRSPNWRVFFTSGDAHTYVQASLTDMAGGEPLLADWLAVMIDEDADWQDRLP